MKVNLIALASGVGYSTALGHTVKEIMNVALEETDHHAFPGHPQQIINDVSRLNVKSVLV